MKEVARVFRGQTGQRSTCASGISEPLSGVVQDQLMAVEVKRRGRCFWPAFARHPLRSRNASVAVSLLNGVEPVWH
jgi:hypothetical protein